MLELHAAFSGVKKANHEDLEDRKEASLGKIFVVQIPA